MWLKEGFNILNATPADNHKGEQNFNEVEWKTRNFYEQYKSLFPIAVVPPSLSG